MNLSKPTRIWRKRSSKVDLALFMLWVFLLAFVTWTFQVMTQDTIW